jgi:hypothetical protein
MALLNPPEFDEGKEKRKRNLLVGATLLALVAAVAAFSGYVMGHGWLFMNVPAEHRVGKLLAAVKAQDYVKAYSIFYNDPNWQQHPQKYKDYPLQQFTEDFSTDSDWKGPINSYHVDFSKRDNTGTVVASTINGRTNLTLKVQRSDDTIAFFPYVLTRAF